LLEYNKRVLDFVVPRKLNPVETIIARALNHAYAYVSFCILYIHILLVREEDILFYMIDQLFTFFLTPISPDYLF
jgi:hypothetical protein